MFAIRILRYFASFGCLIILLMYIKNVVLQKLEEVSIRFKNVPTVNKNHAWSSTRHSCVSHSIGRRTTMEDDHILIDNFFEKDAGFFGLYDGHGGRATVDFLTSSFYLNLEHYLRKNPNVPMNQVFEDVYEITDKQIHRQQIYQSGSTAVTCFLRKESNKKMLYVANVGDLRAVL